MIKSTYSVPDVLHCAEFTVPTVDYATCLNDVKTELSRVKYILFVAPDSTNNLVAKNAPTAQTALAWASLIDNSKIDGVRQLAGVGDFPKPAIVKADVNGQERIIAFDYTLNFKHNNISAFNYELLRKLQNANLFLWFITEGGYIYGGLTGIRCTVAEANHILTSGKDDIASHDYVFQWRHTNYMEREISPII